jgi:Leucine-rich repeat (LRR) protein
MLGEENSHDIKETSKAVLYLNNNKLKQIEATLPKGIDTIYLDDNNISEITPNYTVSPLITLSGLCLRGNRISHTKTCICGFD